MPLPRTLLFPIDDARVEIQQGGAADCFILATLDCLFNIQPGGYAKIKSMFKVTAEGVELRIKRNSASIFLEKKKDDKALDGKYIHAYDPVENEDIFSINNAQLDIIDRTSAVISNALAVKIFERVISYYYATDWHKPAANAGAGLAVLSVMAHKEEHKFDGTTAPQFLSNLLGIYADNLASIENVKDFKASFPDYPVYIEMDWTPDPHTHLPRRHALRLDKIEPNKSGGFNFVLVNPHNNLKTETYEMAEIKAREPGFYIYSVDLEKHQLFKALLELGPAKKREVVDQIMHHKYSAEKIESYPLMPVSLTETDIFQRTLKSAIEKKSARDHISYTEASKMIRTGVAAYYFSNNLMYVTNGSSLRTLFENNIFHKSMIKDVLNPEALLRGAMHVYAKDKKNITAKNYICEALLALDKKAPAKRSPSFFKEYTSIDPLFPLDPPDHFGLKPIIEDSDDDEEYSPIKLFSPIEDHLGFKPFFEYPDDKDSIGNYFT